MEGLKEKPWVPSINPADFVDRVQGKLPLVVQPDQARYCPKFALPPGFWQLDDLPSTSRLRDGEMLGKWVGVSDLPPGRVLAVSCGVSVHSGTVQWMCPCGVGYAAHTVGKDGGNE